MGSMSHTADASPHAKPGPSRTRSEVIDWACFSYLTAERAELYRAVIEVFAAAKAEFALHLRSGEVRQGLTRLGDSVELSEVESALQQLEAWGNLQSYQDNTDVSSLNDYYRKRLLYQLSAAGEAAHASTLTFAQRLQQAAKLDARALERIASASGQLRRLVLEMRSGDEIDSVVTLTTIRNLCQDTDELTSRAQSFFRWLHEQTEAERGDLEAFLNYKNQLIEYLQQFVGELILRSSEISEYLLDIRERELERLAQIAASEDVGTPNAALQESHEARLATTTQQWKSRLNGLRGWFVPGAGRPPQSAQLRAAARAAIPRLLQLAAQMNERQSGRSDRVSDLKVLARRFLQCRDDDQAHQLYRAAFALSPARHLRVDQATLIERDQQPVSSRTRWLDADPVVIAPQLRASGRAPSAGVNRRGVDRKSDRAKAKRRLSLEAGRDDASRETLIALGRCQLAEVGELDRHALGLLVELIEQAVAKPQQAVSAETPVIARSHDGTLQIRLWPPVPTPSPGPTQRHACIRSQDGTLMLPDGWMEVTRGR